MHFTPGRSPNLHMDYEITNVEDSTSFPKQFSDRKSVHGFGGGDAPKLTDENDPYRKSRKFMDFTNVLGAL